VGSRITEEKVTSAVAVEVLKRIAADDIVLPALPVVASKCLALLSGPDFSLDQVARLIETDPILAAQVVRLANVASRAPVTPVRSIVECATRVGASELRVFLLETSARRIFESSDREISEMCRGLWQHSLAVAILARDLLQQAKSENAEAGYLGGLLHDIGKPVTAAMLLDAERRLRGKQTQNWFDPNAWSELISSTHRVVGAALAEKWGLPDAVQRSIHECDDYDSTNTHSTANAVRFANALAKQAGVYVGPTDDDEVRSQVFVGQALFAIDEERVQYLTTFLKERVNERMV
jgi:putative nucleotidyltransferase with HDIG domain